MEAEPERRTYSLDGIVIDPQLAIDALRAVASVDGELSQVLKGKINLPTGSKAINNLVIEGLSKLSPERLDAQEALRALEG